MVEPTPQPQASLADFIKWFITTLSEEITGALPSLFGAATGENTVGNAVIQRDQALQRIGCPWNNIQYLFAEAARQAVKCAADCREGKKISQTIPGRGLVTVNTSNLAGNVLCYPESDPSFPESSAQREAKLTSLVDVSTSNQALQQWIFSPANLPMLQAGLRLKSFKVPGATSITKQKFEMEVLLRSGPMPNPKLAQIQQILDQAATEMQAKQAQGLPPDPKELAAVMQMQQLQKTLPPTVSTVPVAQDESELHALEAAQVFEWMNSTEGQKFANGNPAQRAAFENAHVHWQEHMTVAKQIAAANAPPQKPPSESLSVDVSKMPADVAVQALAKMGIKATPDDFAQHEAKQLDSKIKAKVIPESLKEGKTNAPAPQGAPGGEQQPRQLRR
jgi:hypothetical protein